ncbi:LPP20 family lipoprotein [uncultured Helicobacter sp.]|uniref:LPP20 family lipoprotein n=1 Tax=uncultured Helicobacter sp. TaxID=175537 RepID=UPI001C3C10E7|nr:LPP20 family lipoprotein [Candidatus Helicobacter avicola]
MKKLCTLLISGLIAFGFLGCPSKNELGNTSGFDLEGAPSWVLGKPEKELYAVGSSQIKNNKVDWAIREATLKARAELATTLQGRIEQKIRSLETNGESETVIAIRQSVDALLPGASRTDTWISKGGMLFAKVQIREIDNKILQKNLANLQKIDQEAAKALAQTVDELLK